MSEDDNLQMWNGRPGAYEVWFLTFTDPVTGLGHWIRYTTHAPKRGESSAAVWFARFDPGDPESTFGIHRRFDRWEGREDRLDLQIGDSVVASGRATGALSGEGREVAWDLSFPTGEPTYRPLPRMFYRRAAASALPYGPNVSTPLSGTVTVDGERLELETVLAHQGHVFGWRHAERWAWAHCSDFVGEEAVLYALTAQGRRGSFLTPFVTSIGVLWQGRWIRVVKVVRRRDFGLGTWRVDAGNRRWRITGRIEAPTRALLRARYEDPDGTDRHCHHSDVASSKLTLFERRAGGFEEVAVLESRGTTQAEWAGRTPGPGVDREHREIEG